jgi:membrane protein DedA with SNARE-associated domain
MQYPAKKFLAALTLGRAIRYLLLAYLADRYARPILRFIGEYGHPGLLAIVAVILCIAGIIFYVWRTKFRKQPLSKADGRAA